MNGKWKTIEKEIDLNADKKRLWMGDIESIDSEIMHESVPIPINYFNN